MAVDVGQQGSSWVLRAGRPEDHALFIRLFAELGVDDPPPPPPVWESELAPLTVFAEGRGGVVAYAMTESLGEVGYVGQLVVDPSARGQGLGRWMMARLAERLRAQGCQRWALYVKRDNLPALRLYTSVGMRPVREAATLLVTRAQVAALPAAPPGLRLLPVGLEEHAPLTAAFGMIPGKLARFAAKPSHQLSRLVDPAAASDAPLGVMDQRAAGRLLFPFFAVSPGHARALLEAAFAQLPDDVAALNLVVTDDARLDGLLREAGAEVRHETLELRGPLPPPGP
ncbi:GNAT family N-acetyltransferase [Pyxidicoccus trucidator]|uniref:GNAT family N-acetyltransferase n=1 Tax=Pyxidicoccus trucidator TaxID=2709662 RepID=UPI001F081B90|nr:GNAT family N-acetyltransferase [Pyxidicoccus trucidator]